jgi:hypothetical protein
MATKRWQDWVNLVLGLWLFVSPWALQYAGSTAAWNAYVMGAGIVVFAAVAAYVPRAWEEVINAVLGVGLVISPFVLGFAGTTVPAVHTIAIGVLVTAFAIWAMLADPAIQQRWRRGHSV